MLIDCSNRRESDDLGTWWLRRKRAWRRLERVWATSFKVIVKSESQQKIKERKSLKCSE